MKILSRLQLLYFKSRLMTFDFQVFFISKLLHIGVQLHIQNLHSSALFPRLYRRQSSYCSLIAPQDISLYFKLTLAHRLFFGNQSWHLSHVIQLQAQRKQAWVPSLQSVPNMKNLQCLMKQIENEWPKRKSPF